MFSTERDQLRKKFFDAWQKHLNQSPVEPLEAEIIQVVLLHPEYHVILNDLDTYQARDFAEGNPFLHMSLHLAMREQLRTNRPHGIVAVFQRYCQKFQDPHVAEHQMMEVLTQVLWQAQQEGKMPDEQVYLELLRGKI